MPVQCHHTQLHVETCNSSGRRSSRQTGRHNNYPGNSYLYSILANGIMSATYNVGLVTKKDTETIDLLISLQG